jgi:hypothetical protein
MNQEALDNALHALIKADRAHRIALGRVKEKLDVLMDARERHRDAMRLMGYEEETFGNKTKWISVNENAHPNGKYERLLAVDTGTVQQSQPSIEAIVYHFEVDPEAASAILDFANAHGDNLNTVINRQWHIR